MKEEKEGKEKYLRTKAIGKQVQLLQSNPSKPLTYAP
jgi:hypothetical protein